MTQNIWFFKIPRLIIHDEYIIIFMKGTNRLTRESATLRAMLRLYCHDHHGGRADLCTDCRELHEYALDRLEKCPFRHGKTTCARCPIHCYQPDMRTRVKAVMRYAGPRMLYAHPIMALRHAVDSLRKEPREPA